MKYRFSVGHAALCPTYVVLLLVLFVALLAARILCWAWVKPANLAEKKVAGCFLMLDRAVVTTLAVLLLYLTGFHAVHDASWLRGD